MVQKVPKVLGSLWEALHESAETPRWREIPGPVAQPHSGAVLQVCVWSFRPEPRVASDDCVPRVLKGSVPRL